MNLNQKKIYIPYILYITLLLLVSGCRKEEKDWILGEWDLVATEYCNPRTGERSSFDAGFKRWEFLEDGVMYIDVSERHKYTHTDGKVTIDGIAWEILAARTDMMQVTPSKTETYTFKKVSSR